MTRSIIPIAITLVALTLGGCGISTAVGTIAADIKSGQSLDTAIATVSAADAKVAATEAAALHHPEIDSCLVSVQAYAGLVAADGKSPGIFTDLVRALGLKDVKSACAASFISAGGTLMAP